MLAVVENSQLPRTSLCLSFLIYEMGVIIVPISYSY